MEVTRIFVFAIIITTLVRPLLLMKVINVQDVSEKWSDFSRGWGGGDTATKSRYVNAGMHKRYPVILLLVVIDHLSFYIAVSHKCSRCIRLIMV